MITCPNCQHRFPIDYEGFLDISNDCSKYYAEMMERMWAILSDPPFIATSLRLIFRGHIVFLDEVANAYVRSRHTFRSLLAFALWYICSTTTGALICTLAIKTDHNILGIIALLCCCSIFTYVEVKLFRPAIKRLYCHHTLHLELKDGRHLTTPISEPYIAPSIMNWVDHVSNHPLKVLFGEQPLTDPYLDPIAFPNLKASIFQS